MGVEPKNRGFLPPNPWNFNMVWNHFKPSILRVFPPIFGNTQIASYNLTTKFLVDFFEHTPQAQRDFKVFSLHEKFLFWFLGGESHLRRILLTLFSGFLGGFSSVWRSKGESSQVQGNRYAKKGFSKHMWSHINHLSSASWRVYHASLSWPTWKHIQIFTPWNLVLFDA